MSLQVVKLTNGQTIQLPEGIGIAEVRQAGTNQPMFTGSGQTATASEEANHSFDLMRVLSTPFKQIGDWVGHMISNPVETLVSFGVMTAATVGIAALTGLSVATVAAPLVIGTLLYSGASSLLHYGKSAVNALAGNYKTAEEEAVKGGKALGDTFIAGFFARLGAGKSAYRGNAIAAEEAAVANGTSVGRLSKAWNWTRDTFSVRGMYENSVANMSNAARDISANVLTRSKTLTETNIGSKTLTETNIGSKTPLEYIQGAVEKIGGEKALKATGLTEAQVTAAKTVHTARAGLKDARAGVVKEMEIVRTNLRKKAAEGNKTVSTTEEVAAIKNSETVQAAELRVKKAEAKLAEVKAEAAGKGDIPVRLSPYETNVARIEAEIARLKNQTSSSKITKKIDKLETRLAELKKTKTESDTAIKVAKGEQSTPAIDAAKAQQAKLAAELKAKEVDKIIKDFDKTQIKLAKAETRPYIFYRTSRRAKEVKRLEGELAGQIAAVRAKSPELAQVLETRSQASAELAKRQKNGWGIVVKQFDKHIGVAKTLRNDLKTNTAKAQEAAAETIKRAEATVATTRQTEIARLFTDAEKLNNRSAFHEFFSSPRTAAYTLSSPAIWSTPRNNPVSIFSLPAAAEATEPQPTQPTQPTQSAQNTPATLNQSELFKNRLAQKLSRSNPEFAMRVLASA